MKQLISKYRSLLLFLGKFILSYALLLAAYQLVLYFSTIDKKVDFITAAVSKISFYILDFILPNIKMTMYNNYTISLQNLKFVTIIEGCNGMSVIILFTAFIIGFSKGLKNTLRYILLGSAILFIMNIFRILLITIGLYYYPEYGNLLHEVVFPLIIYGAVLILWFIWINRFKDVAKTN